MGLPILYSVCFIAWAWFLVANWRDLTHELRIGCMIFCSLFFAMTVLSTVGLIVTSG